MPNGMKQYKFLPNSTTQNKVFLFAIFNISISPFTKLGNIQNIIIGYQRVMQIRSDEQFQDLEEDNGSIKQVKDSHIRGNGEQREKKKNNRVQIKDGQNMNEMNLLENQYYTVTVYKDDKEIKKGIQRRFSDFDVLFEILFRTYKGRILPAFPENGILSYVKSKVSLTKDDKFLKERIAMVERFLTILLNQTSFDYENSPQIIAFLSQKQLFDLIKKKEKQKSQGILGASWNKIINYMKISKQNKYKVVQDQLLEEKKKFEELYRKIKCMISLLEQQRQEYADLKEKNLAVPGLLDYFNRADAVSQCQLTNLEKLRKIEFEAYCQNEDYMMVIKLLESIDELKGNQENYSSLEVVEKTFRNDHQRFRNLKKETLQKLFTSFNNILQDVSREDAKF